VDIACLYTLTTPGGTIKFNDGTLGSGSIKDLYWISALHGLDGPTIRFPTDDVPFGDGGLAHHAWRGPMHPVLEGDIVIQSVKFGADCRGPLNAMENALEAALNSILAPTSGTLAWTPTGLAARSLPVFYEITLDVQPDSTYALRHYSFGLFSTAPAPT
jgi:hypothetical protein